MVRQFVQLLPTKLFVLCSRATIFGLIVLACSLGRASVIVNDTWKDGTDSDPASPTFSENGVDSDADGDIESAWLQGGDGTLDPVGAGGPERATFTSPAGTSSAAWTTYFTPEGSEATLANAGDKLVVTWKFTPTNINNGGGSNTSQNFRFAVADSVVGAGSARTTGNGTLANAVYTGYTIFGNMGTTLGNSHPFQLKARTATATGKFLDNSGDWGTALADGAVTGNHGFDSGTAYTMTWTMTRDLVTPTSLDIDVKITGGTTLNGSGTEEATFVDAAPTSFKFDTFGIRPSSALTTAAQFDTSLFSVELISVPEPTSLVLMGLGVGALGLCSLRRKTALS